MRRHPDLNIHLAVMATPEEAQRFAEETGAAHPIVCDPQRGLFQAFGMERAQVGQIYSLKVFRRTAEALRAGHRMSRPTADPRQLGGAVVLNRTGDVVWRYQATDVSDYPTAALIREQLDRAAVKA